MEQWDLVQDAPLYEEHLLLGARYDTDEPLLAAPVSYGDALSEVEAFNSGCALVDMSGMTAVLVTGEGSASFVAASCARSALTVGSCGFGAVVAGDGTTTSIPLVGRTGANEYLLWDPTERGLSLMPWLGFLAGIEQDGFKPFEDVTLEDVSASLVPLLVWGPQATAIVGDYVPSLDALPGPGQVMTTMLDRIQCLVAAPEVDAHPCYLLMVPPRAARVIWRSLLSFGAMGPAGTKVLSAHATQHLPWLSQVLGTNRLELPFDQLVEWGIARSEGGFVGARSLEGC